MLHALVLILGCQIAGEAATRGLGLPLPGPVAGLALLLALMAASPRLAALVRPTGEGILRHLGLLFVPAGVGVVGHLGTLADAGPGLAVALIASTVLAIAAGALAFAAVALLTQGRPDA
jgi:putative effector of murein hydrolase LrgA (UPF0299 family)